LRLFLQLQLFLPLPLNLLLHLFLPLPLNLLLHLFLLSALNLPVQLFLPLFVSRRHPERSRSRTLRTTQSKDPEELGSTKTSRIFQPRHPSHPTPKPREYASKLN
jgi:hypothetical protein